MDSERRNSHNRPLERSASYSEAIKSSSDRFSIEIPSLVRSEVYTNEELKKQYRISQNYVEGREIQFPVNHSDTGVYREASSDSTSDDDDSVFPNGLVMKIDVEPCDSESLPKYSSPATTAQVSSTSPRQTSPSEDLYDVIETEESVFSAPETISSPTGYSTPYSRRKRRVVKHRLRQGRPNRSRRVVFKTGEENVPVRSNIPAKSIKYMRDIVNTVINSKWRFILLMMVVAHFCFWLFFAGIWVWVSRAYQEDIGDGKDHCVTGTSSFAGMLMMAVETQMTIGYGTRFPNEECPEAIIVMVLEIVAGTALSGGLTSLLFTKLVRPNRHVSSVGFSKKATVCLRDGELCLQFRVWDLLNVHVISTSITAYMLKPIRTLEGEFVQNYIHHLKLVQANSFLLWPITVAHIIDQNSPLYDLSAEDMMDFRFEIVVCLTGSSYNLGTMTQSRTSYLSKEIIWGYRFKNVLNYSKKDESYIIDTENLNSVEQVETPLCSASKLKEFEDASRKNYDEYDGSTVYQGSSPSTLRTGNSSTAQTDIWSRNGAAAALARSLSARIQPDVWQANPKLATKDWQKNQKGWQNCPEGWLNSPSSTASPRDDSVQSTPNFSRHGTQKSIGWSFRRFTRDQIVEDRFKGLNS